jgi:hypothetical protein
VLVCGVNLGDSVNTVTVLDLSDAASPLALTSQTVAAVADGRLTPDARAVSVSMKQPHRKLVCTLPAGTGSRRCSLTVAGQSTAFVVQYRRTSLLRVCHTASTTCWALKPCVYCVLQPRAL